MKRLAIVLAAAACLVFATGASATVFLHEGFETGGSGWETTGVVEGQEYSLWHLESYRAYSGEYSAAYNTGSPNYDYNVGWNWGVLMSPWIDISGAGAAYMDFYSWLETEDGPFHLFDNAHVMVSPGPGMWVPLTPDVQSFDQGEWVGLQADLNAFLGEDAIRVGFYFDTGDPYMNDYEGWYVDHITVHDGQSSPVPEPSTWLLLSTGLIGVGTIVKRRFLG